MDLPSMLKVLASQDGSDLYLSTGAPPCAKFNGVLKPLSADPLKPGMSRVSPSRSWTRSNASNSTMSWR